MDAAGIHYGYHNFSYQTKSVLNSNVSNTKSDAEPKLQTENDKIEFKDIVAKKREEYLEKIKNGETEPTFQIGSSTFTLTEWNKLMEKIDTNIETMKEELEAEEEKSKTEQEAEQIQLQNSQGKQLREE
jgi:hypothetical protein